jgi:RES domain-containing protein
MAKYDDILRRIRSLRACAVPWSGIVYRSCSVEYSRQGDLLMGLGAAGHGGRWNPRGLRSVYASLDPAGAMGEVLGTAGYFGFAPSTLMPRVFVAVQVVLDCVLDLTTGPVRQRLRVSCSRLLAEDWRKAQDAGGEALTQQIGRAARDSGLVGLLVPSAPSPRARNLVWFPDNLRSTSEVAICNADRLPK